MSSEFPIRDSYDTECQQWSPWISLIADQPSDQEPPESHQEFLIHLQDCPSCQMELDRQRQINASILRKKDRAGESVSDPNLSINMMELLDQIDEETTSPSHSTHDTKSDLIFQAALNSFDSATAEEEQKPNKRPAFWSKEVIGGTLALALSLLLIIWITLPGKGPEPTTGGKIPAKDITSVTSKHFQTIRDINKDQWLDQQLMVRSMELELQALRMKINELNADPAAKKRVLADIDKLLDAVTNVETPDLAPTTEVKANPAVHSLPSNQ